LKRRIKQSVPRKNPPSPSLDNPSTDTKPAFAASKFVTKIFSDSRRMGPGSVHFLRSFLRRCVARGRNWRAEEERAAAIFVSKEDARKAIVAQWQRLPAAERADIGQACQFVIEAMKRYSWRVSAGAYEEAVAWLEPYVGKPEAVPSAYPIGCFRATW
jgi:hypothetical protein